MIVFNISEPRYMFMEYLNSINVEYTSDKFLMFLSNSLFRIIGISLSINPPLQISQQDVIITDVASLDSYVTKYLPFAHIANIRTTGQVGDYYLIRVVGNSGVLYHVNEISTVHNTLS